MSKDAAWGRKKAAGRKSLLRFWQDTSTFGLSTLLAGLFNYFFSVWAAHGLGPGRYGQLVTYLNITSFLLIASPVVALIYTRLGRLQRGGREYLLLWMGGAFLWLLVLALGPRLSAAFSLSQVGLAAFCATVVPALALAANTGLLQRRRSYAWVGLLNAGSAGATLTCVGLGLWQRWPLPVLGLSFSAVTFLAWGASQWMVRPTRVAPVRRASRLALGTAWVAVLWIIFGITDGLVARGHLPAQTAGLYIGLVTLGQSIPYFSATFGTVMLTASLSDPGRALRYLARSLLLYSAVAAVGLALFALAGRAVVAIVLGASFSSILPYLLPYGWAMAALGFVNIFMLFSVARGEWWTVSVACLGYVAWFAALWNARTAPALVGATFDILCPTAVATAATAIFVFMRKARRGPREPASS